MVAKTHYRCMSDDEFRLLRDCIYAQYGIHFAPDSKYILEKRLSGRLTDLDLPTFQEYCRYIQHLQGKEQELLVIMDVLTNNETYFFREPFQLKAFSEEVIPELITKKTALGNRSLRIWSAGCSTGEEPYTIAMLLSGIPELAGWDIEIIGTDISQKVLQHAQRALYGKSSFRATTEQDLKRFFLLHEDGFVVKDSIRKMVTIRNFNIFDENRHSDIGAVDIIFCRNVMIYFDQSAKKRAIDLFYSDLQGGGFLLLGHSESLMNIPTAFTLRHFLNDMIYQKPESFSQGGAA